MQRANVSVIVTTLYRNDNPDSFVPHFGTFLTVVHPYLDVTFLLL